MKEVFAKITLLSAKEGGRKQAIPLMSFGCPIYIENTPELAGHAYDCRLLVQEYGSPILPGETVKKIKIVFLSPNEVIPLLKIGTRFTLWEGKTIAYGEIISIE
ncbi:hypothetical protein NR756_02685 [Alloalcanivorax xenomutans]|uniref:hypothetical protein n=1 Tax=Alloalcanivorax xenomutans TaxID=1094342 RepID=UPI003A80A732